MPSRYKPVPNDEEQQTHEKNALLSPLPIYSSSPPFVSHSTTHPYLFWICHAILLSFSLAFFALSLLLRATPATTCAQPNYPYSPAESVAGFHTVRYNITPMTDMTEFVGFGPKVDEAWNRITYDVGDQMISRAELDKLGLDPTSLKIKDPKTGHEGYRVGMQVFHQLHCLNLLRQETWKEYYSEMGGDIDVEPEDLRGHLDHCIEFLRTNLMCQSDTGVFAFKYYEGFDGHWPDFSTLHTCRNFDAIRDWAFKHAVVFGDEE
ncbi:hypothetical protein F53441_13638 [Fusarium austroafricanum]|uniref:Cyclochlorotine biosynthesis protein O n=1 Tax=Fusarium austroafricanum TaxID=2364996 RepID=A0A8H4JPP3_9HYPO|nr:hypothetical protein F53441_13638 [Fusarium austroafricanum]